MNSFIDSVSYAHDNAELNSVYVEKWDARNRNPEGFDGYVYGREPTLRQSEWIEKYGNRKQGTMARIGKMAQVCLVDKQGRPLFEEKHIDVFMSKNGGAFILQLFKDLEILTQDESDEIQKDLESEDDPGKGYDTDSGTRTETVGLRAHG